MDGEDVSDPLGEPHYLTADDVLALHAQVVSVSPAEARDRLRGGGWEQLEGAVQRPRAYAHYQGADIAVQAAVLAHGIAETQPFIDGNKRTALQTLLTFLVGQVTRTAPLELSAEVTDS